MKSLGKTIVGRLCALACASAVLVVSVAAQQAARIAREVGFDQKRDSQVPLALSFRDEAGRTIELGDCFRGKPVVLTLVYYECPMLCTQVLNGLVHSLRALELEPGTDFELVTVSIQPKDTSELARAKKRHYLEEYGRSGADQAWHFLTGDQRAIADLADSVGFRYVYDAGLEQFAHASGFVVLTPSGRVSKYFYGVEYSARDLRLALVEASAGRIGTLVDQVLLLCYHYDPMTGKYGVVIMNVMRLAGLLTVGCLVAFMILMLRRERRRIAYTPGEV